MTKQRAISVFCKECAGDSFKEVTLCHLFDCPLWPWRTGLHISSKGYAERIAAGLSKYPEEVVELVKMGVDISRYTGFLPEKPVCAPVLQGNSAGCQEPVGEGRDHA
jgi:hypothetical protein